MDTNLPVYLMIYIGAAIMLTNIIRYAVFTRSMKWMERTVMNRLAIWMPLVLLVLFFAGYLAAPALGTHSIVIAAILLGGSIFVCIILTVLFYIVDRVRENERELTEARDASRAKSAFLSNISHDIRTPLNAIIGYTQLAERPSVTEAEMRGYLEKICSSGQHLMALVNDTLEMSRIESGRLELEPAETDLQAVMGGLRDMFASQTESKGLRYAVESGDVADPIVLCDRNCLNRVLLNLVGNACKFTPEGGSITVTLRQTGRAEDMGDYEFCVRDTGIGMSPEFAARIFDAFERERTSTVSGIEGTGLGMAISKNIVELMGGTIGVETEQGKGTAFTVRLTLPVLEGTAAQEAACGCGAADAALPEKTHLLLVEDNEVNREIATLMLCEMGFTLETAENGRVAVERMAASKPGEFRAILMDVQMPEMNGYEATRRIRALEDPALASVPIIAMTANAFAEDIRTEKDAGMTAHISKPLRMQEMLDTLTQVIRSASC